MRLHFNSCKVAILIATLLPLFVSNVGHGSDQRRDAEIHADKGLRLAQAGNLPEAEIELRIAVQVVPDDAGFLSNLGTILAMERKLEDSTGVFERALRVDPKDVTTRRYLAANLWQLHRYPEAKRNLEIILNQAPNDKESRLLLGMVSENMKDYPTAIRMLGSVPAQVRERPESIAALARSYYHLGQRKNAQRSLEELLTHPSGARGILLGAQVADEMKDYDTAEKLITAITSQSTDQATVGYELALVQYHAKRFAESQRTLLSLISSGYKSSQAFNLLGWCYHEENQPADAARAMQEAIDLDPTQESNYLDLEKILLARGSLPSALGAAKRASDRFPDSPLAFLMRGSIELKMSQFTDAVSSYTRALRLDPVNPDASLGLAEAQSNADLDKEAVAGFEAAIKKFPKDPRFRLQYALTLLKQAESGNLSAETRAEQLLKSAVALTPPLPEVHFLLGDLAQKKNRTTEALAEFRHAAKLDPQSAKVHFALARVYRRLGRNAEASREMNLYQRLKESESKAAMPPSGTGASQD